MIYYETQWFSYERAGKKCGLGEDNNCPYCAINADQLFFCLKGTDQQYLIDVKIGKHKQHIGKNCVGNNGGLI